MGTPRDNPARARTLRELAERIEAVERKDAAHAGAVLTTELPAPLASLALGVLHEWLCDDDGRAFRGRGRSLTPPLVIFAHLAHRALTAHESTSLVIWIGKHIWPTAHTLACTQRGPDLLAHSLLVDPASDGERLWAIDLCLRSPAAAVVIADASAMQLSHSRRLQLAAEAGASLALLARPNREQTTLSAASMRWRVTRARSPTHQPRWRIERVRCKGVQRGKGMDADASLIVEHCRATGGLCVPADLADRSAEAPAATRAPLPGAGVRRTG